MKDDGYSAEVGIHLEEIDPALLPASLMRLKLDDGALERYAEILTSLDPVRLRWDPDKKIHWVEDGAHRITVARKAGLAEIRARVSAGSYEDAFRAASRANDKHGVPITNADKRHRVEMALKHPEMSKWSSRRLAEACGVSPDFASRLRPEQLSSDDSSKTVGRDGKARPASRPRKPKPKPAPRAEPTPEPAVAAPAPVLPPSPEQPEPAPPAPPAPAPEPLAAPVAEPGPTPEPDPPPFDWKARSAEEEAAIVARYDAWPEVARAAFVIMLWNLASKLNERHPDVVFRTNVPFE